MTHGNKLVNTGARSQSHSKRVMSCSHKLKSFVSSWSGLYLCSGQQTLWRFQRV